MTKRQAINVSQLALVINMSPEPIVETKETMTLHILLKIGNTDDTWLPGISQPLDMAMLVLNKPYKPYYSE